MVTFLKTYEIRGFLEKQMGVLEKKLNFFKIVKSGKSLVQC